MVLLLFRKDTESKPVKLDTSSTGTYPLKGECSTQKNPACLSLALACLQHSNFILSSTKLVVAVYFRLAWQETPMFTNSNSSILL